MGSQIKLIAGLGNPGSKYDRTRHNVGFRAIDRLLESTSVLKKRSTETAELFETKDYGLLCKPMTYMNRSGKALLDVSRETEVAPPDMLVIYDDFALQLGMIRIRQSGTSGGHNGVQSIVDYFGTTDFPRVRLGIQTEEMESWSDFVLDNFKRKEIETVKEMLDACTDAVELILKSGITTAMNRYNRKQNN